MHPQNKFYGYSICQKSAQEIEDIRNILIDAQLELIESISPEIVIIEQ